jgi:hypothetical protein
MPTAGREEVGFAQPVTDDPDMSRAVTAHRRALRFAAVLAACAAIAAVAAGCGSLYGRDGERSCGRCSVPGLMLGDGLRFFHDDETLYWIGPRMGGYSMYYLYIESGDPTPPSTVPGEPVVVIQYQAHLGTEVNRTLEVRTYVSASPSYGDYPTVAVVHTKTGQLVAFANPDGPPPSPELVKRMVKALRPVTQAGIDRLPHSWWEIGHPQG